MSDTRQVFGLLDLFSLSVRKADRKEIVLFQHLLNNRIDHHDSESDRKQGLIRVSWHYIVTALDA